MATWSFPPKIYFRVLWVIICEGMTILLCICLQHVGWYSSLVGLNISCQLLVFTSLCAKGGGEFCETLSLQVFLSRFSRALRGPLQSGAQSSLAPRSWRDVLDLLWNGSTWSVLQVHVGPRGNIPQRKAASNYMAGADNLEREAGRHICCLHVSLGHHKLSEWHSNIKMFWTFSAWMNGGQWSFGVYSYSSYVLNAEQDVQQEKQADLSRSYFARSRWRLGVHNVLV